MRKLVVIKNCAKECPHIKTERTPRSGYAMDYFCTKAKPTTSGMRLVRGYVEWTGDLPKDGEFPAWCPLFEAEPGMYE